MTAACSGEKIQSPNFQVKFDQIEPAVMKVKQSAAESALIEAAITESLPENGRNVATQSEALRHAKEKGMLVAYFRTGHWGELS